MIRGAFHTAVAEPAATQRGPVAVSGVAPVDRGARTVWLDGPGGAGALAAAEDPAPVLGRLGGRWLACVHDAQQERLWLATDPLGARSLHYATVGGGLVFGEDVADVLALLRSTPAPDRRTLAGWLAYGILAPEASLFEGVRRLPPGCVLLAARGGVTVRPSWSPAFREPLTDPAPVIAERLRDEVDAAVARAAAGSARPGVLLSGGFDSTTVAAALVAGGRRPAAFSTAFPQDADADERALVELAAREIGVPLALRSVTGGDPLAGDAAYIDRWCVPSTSPSTWLWVPQLAEAAVAGIDAMFDGEGGDELFGADPFAVITDRFATGHLVDAWRMTRRFPGRAGASRRTRLAILAYFLRRDLPPAAARRAAGRVPGRRAPRVRVLRPDAARLALDAHEQLLLPAGDGPRWWRARKHALTTMRHLLDAPGTFRRTAALAGIETRHPLMVDAPLVELALRIPPELSFDPRFSRALARDAMAGRVPDRIRLSPRKSSFSAVLTAALLREGDGRLEDLLSPRSRLAELCDPGELDRWSAAAASGTLDARPGGIAQLWRLCAGELWLRRQDST